MIRKVGLSRKNGSQKTNIRREFFETSTQASDSSFEIFDCETSSTNSDNGSAGKGAAYAKTSATGAPEQNQNVWSPADFASAWKQQATIAGWKREEPDKRDARRRLQKDNARGEKRQGDKAVRKDDQTIDKAAQVVA